MENHFSNAQRAQVLTEALPHIKRYTGKIVVVKYGGNAMVNEQIKEQVMEDIVLLWLIGVKIVLVHGGGPEITEMLSKVGKETVFVDGLRVTDEPSSEYYPDISVAGWEFIPERRLLSLFANASSVPLRSPIVIPLSTTRPSI